MGITRPRVWSTPIKGLVRSADRQLRLGASVVLSNSYRVVALSRRLPGRELQLPAPEEARSDAGRGNSTRLMADRLAVLNMPIKAFRRSATITSFEPFTLLSALAGATERIDLIPTASTTFDSPSTSRAASRRSIASAAVTPVWNIVTTSNPDAALNFGREDHLDHDERYRRAREFYDVVTGLWDSFARTRSSATSSRGSISIRIACIRSTTRVSSSRFAVPSISPTPPGLAGRRAGGRLRGGPSARRRNRGGDFRRWRLAC